MPPLNGVPIYFASFPGFRCCAAPPPGYHISPLNRGSEFRSPVASLTAVPRTAGAFFTTAQAVLHHLPQADSSPCPTGILHHGVSRSFSQIPRAQRAEFRAPVGRYKIDRGGAALAAKPRGRRQLIGTPEGWYKGLHHIVIRLLSMALQEKHV